MLKITKNNVLVKSEKGLLNTIFSICNQYERDDAVSTLFMYKKYGLLNDVLEHLSEKFSNGVNEVKLLDYLENGIQSEKLYKKLKSYQKLYEMKNLVENMGIKVDDKEVELCKDFLDNLIEDTLKKEEPKESDNLNILLEKVIKGL